MNTTYRIIKYGLTVTPEYDGTWLVIYGGKWLAKHKSLGVAVINAVVKLKQL